MTRNEFVDYLLEFYGDGGIYTKADDPFYQPMRREEAQRAAAELRAHPNFEGDSFDRERARDLVLTWRATPPDVLHEHMEGKP